MAGQAVAARRCAGSAVGIAGLAHQVVVGCVVVAGVARGLTQVGSWLCDETRWACGRALVVVQVEAVFAAEAERRASAIPAVRRAFKAAEKKEKIYM